MTKPFRRNTGEVLEVIQASLSPYVGRLMASTAAAAHCRTLGIDGDRIDGVQIDQLLEKLTLGLVIFVGKDKTDAVIASIRRALESLGEAP
jgi:hypothetical protein